jgi:hypothetical protein
MIISINKGGLSNRIKSIVSSIRIKPNNYGVKWDILDSYDTHCHILNCPFNKLFLNKVEVKKTDKTMNIFNSHCLVIFEEDNLPINFNNFKSNCGKKFSKSDKLNRNIDFMYNKIPKKIKKDYIKCFKVLKPIDELQQKIDKYSKQFNDKTISVHIRSWNRNGENSRRDYLFNIQKFENEMKKYDKDYTFYIATDSKDVQNYFKNKSELKDRIFIYSRETDLDTSRDFPEGVQEDLIELYLLSKNKIIIGSHFSTFTETAWWLAECPENITIL